MISYETSENDNAQLEDSYDPARVTMIDYDPTQRPPPPSSSPPPLGSDTAPGGRDGRGGSAAYWTEGAELRTSALGPAMVDKPLRIKGISWFGLDSM